MDNRIKDKYKKYGNKLHKHKTKLVSFLNHPNYEIFCNLCNNKSIIDWTKAQSRLSKTNKTICPICEPYEKINLIKKKYYNDLKKYNIFIVGKDNNKKNNYIFNCNNDGHGKFTKDIGIVNKNIKSGITPCPKCRSKGVKNNSLYKNAKLIDNKQIEFFCGKHGRHIIDYNKYYMRHKRGNNPCPICEPYDNFQKYKNSKKNILRKYNIDLIEYNNQEWQINCNLHGISETLPKNKIKNKLKRGNNPCPNCNPYNIEDMFNFKFGDVLNKFGIKSLGYLGENNRKFKCEKHGEFELNFNTYVNRVKGEEIETICPICKPYNQLLENGSFLNKIKNNFSENSITPLVNIKKNSNNYNSIYYFKCKYHGIFNYSGKELKKILDYRLLKNKTICNKCFPINGFDKIIKKYGNFLENKGIKLLDLENGEYKYKCDKGHINSGGLNWIKDRINLNLTPCKECLPIGENNRSGIEKNIESFIKDIYNGEVIIGDREILNGKEIDILLPEMKIGIEINGLFWHNEDNLKQDKKYHKNKTDLANRKGRILYHFFEDEYKQALYFLYNIITNKKDNINIKQINKKYSLNLFNYKNNLYARDIQIEYINKKIGQQFLNEFHIQGKDNADVYIGGYYDKELITVMSFKQGDYSKSTKTIKGEYELSRYCVAGGVKLVGGFNKLLKFFENNFSFKKIYTYSDLRFSDPNNNVYNRNGFSYIGFTGLDYFYIFNNKRYHRSIFQKHKLYKYCKENNIKVDEYKKETEKSLYLKYKNYFKISCIYGCGNIKWEKS